MLRIERYHAATPVANVQMSQKDQPARYRDTQTNIRLTQRDKALLVRLSDDMGLSMNDVVMILVRAEAKRRGLSEHP